MSGIIDTVGAKSGIVGSDVYPSGHIIKSDFLTWRTGGHINTINDVYTDTGIYGTITTKLASSASRLEFDTDFGMKYVETATVGQETICLRASSTTATYAAGDDMLGETVLYKHYDNTAGTHHPMFLQYHYKVGMLVPTNLTSYTAGQTLYWRCFMKSNNNINEFYWFHSSSHVSISYKEIAL